uniref:UDP-glycosyltransferase 1 n=1 Tax=Linum usitatissimum TaxID=4006 RepID=I2BH82_LINUS|nr:UDP-glycosyltransferase 1 [Linum usitatissimum]
MASSCETKKFHIVMFPWLATGHITPFLHLSNTLASKGFTITFILPKKAIQQFSRFNQHPNLIDFHPITLPPVDGLPAGVETASEVPIEVTHFLCIAMDRTRDQVEKIIRGTNPKVVVYDMAHWVSDITASLGIKSVNYTVLSAAAVAFADVPVRGIVKGKELTVDELAVPPPGYPSSTIVLRPHEGKLLSFIFFPYGEATTFWERISTGMRMCDALAIRTCDEIEGKLCEYLGEQYKKRVFLTGPVLTEPANDVVSLENQWIDWLGKFEPGSVVFCAFGSQIMLEKSQFQELVLGFELSGHPFLVALKPPAGSSTIKEALPEGFEERVKGRGIIWGEWVQQVLILNHPSVGCFVNHCGFGSMWESLMSDSQIVLVPHLGDQVLNTRLLADELKVGLEVERDEQGWVSKEKLSDAIKCVMDQGNELGCSLRKNHSKWRGVVSDPDFMSSYIDKFVQNLHDLVK